MPLKMSTSEMSTLLSSPVTNAEAQPCFTTLLISSCHQREKENKAQLQETRFGLSLTAAGKQSIPKRQEFPLRFHTKKTIFKNSTWMPFMRIFSSRKNSEKMWQPASAT